MLTFHVNPLVPHSTTQPAYQNILDHIDGFQPENQSKKFLVKSKEQFPSFY